MRFFIVLPLLVLALALPASADPVQFGASAQCYGASGAGGQDAFRVAVDTANPTAPVIVPPSGTGAAAGLLQAAEYYAGGDGCADAKGAPSPDYLEFHASAAGVSAQVCYNDGASEVPGPVGLGPEGLHVDGSCPTSPPGP